MTVGTPEPGRATRGRGRIGLTATATTMAVGAALCLFSASRPWVTAVVSVADGLPSETRTSSGNDAGAVGALALVALAGAGGLLAARGNLRRGVALLTAVTGLVLVAASVRGLAGASRAATLAAEVGANARVVSRGVSGWPVLCLVGASAVTIAAVWALVAAPRWAALGARFERTSANGRRSGREKRTMTAWESLDSGIDPTDISPATGGSTS